MRLHILGVGGTFMSGVALLAKQRGYSVRGSDMNLYPPMSTQLEKQGIEVCDGYDPAHIDPKVDCVIVGNVIKRGNPAMEYVLDKQLPYQSGPQWLAEHILKDRWVLAVSGTHGKTTTTSMLTWILEAAQQKPGFLIGGIPENFGKSASLGKHPYFVIEADEYDSAFFDKRSKFIHYHPKTLILNNLEFDHADIFPNLDAIKQQFHYLVRTVPANGQIVCHGGDKNLTDVLKMGCWTPTVTFGEGDWQAEKISPDGSSFKVYHGEKLVGEVRWELLGQHNIDNALAALAAASHIGIAPAIAIQALATFKNVKKRLELKGRINDICIYDDFAHHPTAIATTLAGLRAKIGTHARLIAILEFGSYTMRSGVHRDQLEPALRDADMVICKKPKEDWGLATLLQHFKQPTFIYEEVDKLVETLVPQLKPGDHVLMMSNTGFDGAHQKLLNALKETAHPQVMGEVKNGTS